MNVHWFPAIRYKPSLVARSSSLVRAFRYYRGYFQQQIFFQLFYAIDKVCRIDERIIIVFATGEYLQYLSRSSALVRAFCSCRGYNQQQVFSQLFYALNKVCCIGERILIVYAKGQYLQTLKNNP